MGDPGLRDVSLGVFNFDLPCIRNTRKEGLLEMGCFFKKGLLEIGYFFKKSSFLK
jgi:hypothetical protein